MLDDRYTGWVPELRIGEASPVPNLEENSLAGILSHCFARVSVQFISCKCKFRTRSIPAGFLEQTRSP